MPLGAGNGALRLTTARYFTPSGRSIQAKGIEPDIKVLQEVPGDLKGRNDVEGEASLRGTLRRKVPKKLARNPTCRLTKRTIVHSKRRSIFYAAQSLMRRSRAIRMPDLLNNGARSPILNAKPLGGSASTVPLTAKPMFHRQTAWLSPKPVQVRP